MSLWDTTEDFDNDMYLLSDMNDVKDFEAPPPPTIQAWNARMAKNHNTSIYDTDIYDDEDRIISGRGKGQPTIYLKPGIKAHYDHTADADIVRRIRQTSGFGYQNEYLEKTAKVVIEKNKEETNKEQNHLVKLRPTNNTLHSASSSPSRSRRSRTGSNSNSPIHTPSRSTSKSSSPLSIDVIKIENNDNTGNNIEKQTLPLNQMIKLNKKTNVKENVPSFRYKESLANCSITMNPSMSSQSTWTPNGIKPDTEFNINSKMEFPPLHDK